jgi:hypothetical protein
MHGEAILTTQTDSISLLHALLLLAITVYICMHVGVCVCVCVCVCWDNLVFFFLKKIRKTLPRSIVKWLYGWVCFYGGKRHIYIRDIHFTLANLARHVYR